MLAAPVQELESACKCSQCSLHLCKSLRVLASACYASCAGALAPASARQCSHALAAKRVAWYIRKEDGIFTTAGKPLVAYYLGRNHRQKHQQSWGLEKRLLASTGPCAASTAVLVCWQNFYLGLRTSQVLCTHFSLMARQERHILHMMYSHASLLHACSTHANFYTNAHTHTRTHMRSHTIGASHIHTCTHTHRPNKAVWLATDRFTILALSDPEVGNYVKLHNV